MGESLKMKVILDHVADGRDMDLEMAEECFEQLFSGQCSPAQTGGLLLALRAKGETGNELAAAVRAALRQARQVPDLQGPRIDTCGTGGDGKNSFNCSTAVALFLADMGYAVVKHGNRAVSSSCGSADVLEALGLPFAQGSDQVQHQLSRSGFVFLFAPNFHPAFAKLAPLRKDLGVRTVFNLLGPLLNPARPTHQLLGVPGRQFMRPVAEALSLAGIQQAAVVHGAGGFDELTPLGENQCLVVNEGELTKVDIDSRRFGLAVCQEHDLACRDKEQALKVLIGLLKGTGPQAMKDMLTLNLGLAIYLLGQDRDMDQAMRLAGQRVEQGLKREVGRA